MARTWHTPRERPSWWRRHWANPNFSGGLIAAFSVLVVMAVGLYLGVHSLHLDLGHLDLSGLVGK